MDGDKSGFIYLIKEEPNDVEGQANFINFKVGRTVNPEKRLTDLNTGNARQLLMYRPRHVTDAVEREREIHTALQQNNYGNQLGGGTEWYNVPRDDDDRFAYIYLRTLHGFDREGQN